ncbi:TetR/AcrR family transcriptional regulator C-terminal domain-containing protein [Ruania alkalisoli]|uniref:TetR/AcrR family transcriptional regulator C-terminal domain-containing protein n=1 Tax=Ruania alkalisoli TaxID=2779775 RepID=A0A7M1SXS6_9MICO|nr:TetR/AcrR family transcriptional regulator C-terminal domain-containing protein [Ruania alkalisoli]QOR71774.1 TetR/AcrR family transcriptional regulator C-terminal domain-containing protein [Ruania alkalisoli]
MSDGKARAPLSRDRVLSAALRIADVDGLPAVTMRRVAGDLEVEAMSLYHHVRNKEELLDGLVESVVGEVLTEVGLAEAAASPASEDWHASLRRRCLIARTVMVRHSWAPGLIGSRPTIPAPLYLYFEEILAVLVGGGFTYHLAHQALHSLGSMALGFAQELFNPADSGGQVDEGAAEADLAAMAERLPHLTTMVAAELHDHDEDPLGWCDSQREFEFTLDLLLDGLARQLQADSV